MIVENGTGLTNANSFVSVDYADDYFSARGVTQWDSLTDDEKEVLLIKATDFVNASYKWRGKKSTQGQALSFPRTNCIDNDGYKVSGVPNNLKDAVCEASYLLNGGDELFQKAESNGAVTSEHIGSISFTYDTSKKVKNASLYDALNSRLKGLYIESSNRIVSMKVARV